MAHHWLAFYLLNTGAYAAGEAAVRTALRLKTDALGADHPTLSTQLNLLGLLLRRQQRFDEAEAALLQSLALARTWDDGARTQETMALSALATLYRTMGDLAAAERRQREALALTRAHGRSLVAEALSVARLAGILRERGAFPEAEALLLESYDTLRPSFDTPDEPHVRRAAQDLVSLYEAWGRPDEAAQWRARLNTPE